MNSKHHFTLTPVKVLQNETLTVHTDTGQFPENGYVITNEDGRVIRKGSISSNLAEFKLRIVGLQSGVYKLVMGTHQEKFLVM